MADDAEALAALHDRELNAELLAALRAVEIEADVIIKGTRVDGVYDSDPLKNPDAFRFQNIDYLDVLKRDLRVMDLTALTPAKENRLPLIVFGVRRHGNLERVICGEKIGTTVGISEEDLRP